MSSASPQDGPDALPIDALTPHTRRAQRSEHGGGVRGLAALGSPVGPALGNNDGICVHSSDTAKNAEAPAVDLETGELLDAHWSGRLRRWELQAGARELLPDSRLRICYRHRQKQSDFVRVYRRGEADKCSAYYKGLQVCGSVWCCPVCASKITERKRKELIEALTVHRASGGGVMLLTLTVPHTVEHRAFEVADNLLEAFRRFGQGRYRWTDMLPGYVGSVRALEVTHGANGWHPHLHVLVLTAAPVLDVERMALQERLFKRWDVVCQRVGFSAVHPEHGLRLDDGSEAGSYATKWGFAEELTKSSLKVGRREGSRTPWELLADFTLNADQLAGQLFREFAAAFKGKSQLHWSRGLRDRLALEAEKTDEELASETVESEDLLVARISPANWSLIRRHELRGLVLELLRVSDWAAVDLLLHQYRSD